MPVSREETGTGKIEPTSVPIHRLSPIIQVKWGILGCELPGIRLLVQDAEGHYGNSVHVLLYEGHMLAYDPATNF